MQHCCAGSVTCGILVTVALLYFLSILQEVETVCLFASLENCRTLANLKLAMSDVSAHPLKETGTAVSAGTLGYHGPFADVVLSAMPNAKSVTEGFWTRPFATHTEAITFCEAVRKDLRPGSSKMSLPFVHMKEGMTCQRCVQERADKESLSPHKITTCLAPQHFNGYNN